MFMKMKSNSDLRRKIEINKMTNLMRNEIIYCNLIYKALISEISLAIFN